MVKSQRNSRRRLRSVAMPRDCFAIARNDKRGTSRDGKADNRSLFGYYCEPLLSVIARSGSDEAISAGFTEGK